MVAFWGINQVTFKGSQWSKRLTRENTVVSGKSASESQKFPPKDDATYWYNTTETSPLDSEAMSCFLITKWFTNLCKTWKPHGNSPIPKGLPVYKVKSGHPRPRLQHRAHHTHRGLLIQGPDDGEGQINSVKKLLIQKIIQNNTKVKSWNT